MPFPGSWISSTFIFKASTSFEESFRYHKRTKAFYFPVSPLSLSVSLIQTLVAGFSRYDPDKYRDYPRPPSLQCCARNILTAQRDTLPQLNLEEGGGRGKSALLYSVVLPCDFLHRRLWADSEKIPEGGTSTNILHLSGTNLHCWGQWVRTLMLGVSGYKPSCWGQWVRTPPCWGRAWIRGPRGRGRWRSWLRSRTARTPLPLSA